MRAVGVRLVATLVAVIGGVNVLTSVPGHAFSPLAGPVDGTPEPGRVQMLLLGLVLLAIARGLARHRRAAWIGGGAALGFAMLAALVQRRPWAVLICGVALVALVMLRHGFVSRPDPARIRLAAQITLGVAVTAAASGGWDALSHRSAPGGPGHIVIADVSTRSPGNWPAGILACALALAFLSAVVIALAPGSPPGPGLPADRAHAGTLVRHPDSDSLAPFVTRADKAYVFSTDRRAVIGYRVILGTALIGGDPVGARASAPDAMAAYLALCAERGWRPAVLGASDESRATWRELGLRGLHIGDEAVIQVADFSLASRRMRNLRQAVNRTRNAGMRITIGHLTADHAATLAPVLADWLDGEHERGFAMNLDAILIPRPDCLIATAYDRDDRPVAFARFAICGDGGTYTLDVAPRGRHAPNGAAERMIVEIIAHAREHGAGEVSLNFAALRWVFDSPGLINRIAATALHALDRWVEVGPLNRFCAKFAPGWRARSLLTRSWLDIGWVAAAALRAEFSAATPAGAAPAAIPSTEIPSTTIPSTAIPSSTIPSSTIPPSTAALGTDEVAGRGERG